MENQNSVIEKTKSDKNKEYQKQYYKQNKEKLLKNLSEKHTCGACGRKICKYRLQSHLNTKLCSNTKQINEKI